MRIAQARVEIYGDDSKFQAAAKRFIAGTGRINAAAASAGRGMVASAQASTAAFRNLAGGVAGVAATLGGLRAASAGLETLKSFGSEVSRVQALTRTTGEEFESLEAKARELGATTQFTAAQAGSGMAFLAQAGFDANQIIAASGDFLTLAAASGLELSEAMDIGAKSLGGFGLAAEQAGRLADVLAETAATSNTNVSQLGEAFKDAAPIAKTLGISVEEISAAVGQLGNVSIQGQAAGTALRNIFLRLAAGGSEVEAGLQSLNLSLKDVSPSTNSVSKVFEKFQDAVKATGLSADDTASAFSKIFGLRAVAAGSALVGLNSEIGQMAEELRSAEGAAAEMADTINDNLTGDLKRGRSAVDELVLTLGDAGLENALRGRAQDFTRFVRALAGSGQVEIFADRFGKVYGVLRQIGSGVLDRLGAQFENIKSFGSGLFGDLDAGSLAQSFGDGFTKLSQFVVQVRSGLNPALETAGRSVRRIGLAVGEASSRIGKLVGGDLGKFLESLDLKELFTFENFEASVASASRLMENLATRGEHFIGRFTDGFEKVYSLIRSGAFGDVLSSRVTDGLDRVGNFFERVWVNISSSIQTRLLRSLQETVRKGADFFDDLGTDLGGRLTRIVDNLKSGVDRIQSSVGEFFVSLPGKIKDGASRSLEFITDATEGISSKLQAAFETSAPTLSRVFVINRKLFDGITDGLAGVTTSFQAFMLEAFVDIASTGPALIQSNLQKAFEGLSGTKLGELLGLDGFKAQGFEEIKQNLNTAGEELIGANRLREKAENQFQSSITNFEGAFKDMASLLNDAGDGIENFIVQIEQQARQRIDSLQKELQRDISTEAPKVVSPSVNNEFDKATQRIRTDLKGMAVGLSDFNSKLTDITPISPDFGASFDSSLLKRNLDDPVLASHFSELETNLDATTTPLEKFATGLDAAGDAIAREQDRRIRLLNEEESLQQRLNRQSQADIDKAGGRDAFLERLQGNSTAGRSPLDYLRQERISSIEESDLLNRKLSESGSSLDYLRPERITSIEDSDLLERKLGETSSRLDTAAESLTKAGESQRSNLATAQTPSTSNTGPQVKMTQYLRRIAESTAATAKNTAETTALLEERLPTETL